LSDRQASRTALATASLRAAHQLLDGEPRILDDPIAVPLLGEDAARQIRETADRYRTPAASALRSHLVLRARFAEDRLEAAVQRGVTQYVILGAGFDTFALRQPAWARRLKIVEVDHPGTQAAKRSRIAAAGLQIPANASFAQVDFERESLRDGLARQGVSLQEPTFFSWLGVTMYLARAAVDAVLRSIAAFPAGSEIVLTFLPPPPPESAAEADRIAELAQHVAGIGEPFVSYFEPQALETMLLEAGFARVEFLSPEEARARYYAQRPTDLPPPRRSGIACGMR
jgi:methyltransferase (TIGR00027 family)